MEEGEPVQICVVTLENGQKIQMIFPDELLARAGEPEGEAEIQRIIQKAFKRILQ